MTWERRRPIGLSWTLLAAVLLIVGQAVWRYTAGEVPLAQDPLGIAMRVIVLGLLVTTYLRAGGATTAGPDGLRVHDGIRASTYGRDQVRTIEPDPARNGAVAALVSGRQVQLPGVPADAVREVRRQLRRR